MGLGGELGGSGWTWTTRDGRSWFMGPGSRLSGTSTPFSRAVPQSRRAVSNAEIREAVWPERARDEDGVPTAADLEIDTLVMRLRKRLEESGGLVSNLRGYGYMLDID